MKIKGLSPAIGTVFYFLTGKRILLPNVKTKVEITYLEPSAIVEELK